MTEYQYLAASREGFVQQIAVSYVRFGYVFYVKGRIPVGKDAARIDEKLLDTYQIRRSKDSRYKRKKKGLANLQYIRFERDWVMLATKGEHEWFTKEKANIRNLSRRSEPLVVCGYSITLVPGGNILNREKKPGVAGPQKDMKNRVRVQISKARFRELKAEFLSHARIRSEEWYRMRFFHIGFSAYAPVRRQLLALLRMVNKARATHGLSKIGPDCIRYHRKPVKPFAAIDQKDQQSEMAYPLAVPFGEPVEPLRA